MNASTLQDIETALFILELGDRAPQVGYIEQVLFLAKRSCYLQYSLFTMLGLTVLLK